MNKQLILLVFILAIFGCQKIDELTQFEMDFTEIVVIPSSIGINLPFNINTPDVETNSESTFAVNDTRKDLIEEIKLKSFILTLKSPTNADFSFLESISVYISADGLSEVKIAWENNVTSDIEKVLNLEITDLDLKDYIMKDDFNLRLNTVTDELIMSDYTISIKSVFFVDAEILGQ